MSSARITAAVVLGLCTLTVGCGGDDSKGDVDAGPGPVTTDHCDYEPMPAGANATGALTAGALQAGAAEAILDVPVGTALGGFTARAGFEGTAGTVDLREVEWSGAFNPSIGVESAPRVKAVALTADSETIVMIRLDVCFPYEGMTLDIAEKLGPEFRGKVLVNTSHTHSGWGQYTAHTVYQVGAGILRDEVYRAFVDTSVKVAKEALAARRDAKLGVYQDDDFDPDDQINRDRRPENDVLPGGDSDDRHLYVIRIDGTDDAPIAIIPIYGIHGTLMGETNSFASTDSVGGMERVLEEKFDSKVVVMHLQGAGGDVSPVGHGALDCDLHPGNPDDPCFDWLVNEGHGRVAADAIYAAWQAAGDSMESDLKLEMLTRSVELGPDAETFTVRDGELAYAPFEYGREADGKVFDDAGELISPIDEFNAPVGAALCEKEHPLFPLGLMEGTDGLPPYGSCVRMDTAGSVLGQLLSLDFESSPTRPVCQSTRTLVSAIRLGDYVIGTVPGEMSVLLADFMREHSPAPADRSIFIGYSQGFTGYMLMPEDWVQGGYEASTNIWGPLEPEYVAEQSLKLMELAADEQREDGAEGGADRIATPEVVDDVPLDDPAPEVGTVPTTRPERVWLRTGERSNPQPDATIPRISGHAIFTWIGEDPKSGTPVVTLQRETAPDSGTYVDVTRRSGRPVRDAELILSYTPLPLRRDDAPQTHYWTAEWQAVPWLGEQEGELAVDDLRFITGLPLARYRFHVEGTGYTLDSSSFEVTPANLQVEASVNGSDVTVTVTIRDPAGYRLLDETLPSNGPVPLRSRTVTVTETYGATSSSSSISLDANGTATFTAAQDPSGLTELTVEDEFGNTGTHAF